MRVCLLWLDSSGAHQGNVVGVTHLNLAGILEKRGDVDGAIHEVSEFIRKRGHPGIDGEAILARLVEKKGPK